MNIDEASGRSLDALVARHVFGLLVEPIVNANLPTSTVITASELPRGLDVIVGEPVDLQVGLHEL